MKSWQGKDAEQRHAGNRFKMVMKKILIALALLLTGIASGSACTGISCLAEDRGYVQARTIESGNIYLPSEYVVVPRGQELV